jgi:hypothetical protein
MKVTQGQSTPIKAYHEIMAYHQPKPINTTQRPSPPINATQPSSRPITWGS